MAERAWRIGAIGFGAMIGVVGAVLFQAWITVSAESVTVAGAVMGLSFL